MNILTIYNLGIIEIEKCLIRAQRNCCPVFQRDGKGQGRLKRLGKLWPEF